MSGFFVIPNGALPGFGRDTGAGKRGHMEIGIPLQINIKTKK